MEKTKPPRKELVKTIAIVFLAVLLVLTFFSQTIMNANLPEVAAQYVESGSVRSQIRVSGVVSASETYDVIINQTRKIRSVMTKVGQAVEAGDVLFVLEPTDSEELEAAQTQLEEMELNYQKRLLNRTNTSETEKRTLEALQKKYDEALAVFHTYSSGEPSQAKLQYEQCKAEVTTLQSQETQLQNDIASAEELSVLVKEYEKESSQWEDDWDEAKREWAKNEILYRDDYDELKEYADKLGKSAKDQMAAMAEDLDYMKSVMEEAGAGDLSDDHLEDLAEAYEVISKDEKRKAELQKQEDELSDLEDEIKEKERLLGLDALGGKSLERTLSNWKNTLVQLQAELEDRQAALIHYQEAQSAASEVEAAKKALEDAVFENGLSDESVLDLNREKALLDKQKELVNELIANGDGQQVTANVSGVISDIYFNAGATAGAEMPLAKITVTDRGYTLKVSVTAEQARQLRIGEQAEIANSWRSDVTATLETMFNDPQSMGNKVLVFRLGGEVEPDSSLELVLGQKSQTYEALIPNSALRSDANGYFVLVVEAKSTPLGNRFFARRADVTVLASDDTTTAVTGLAGGDYVITTASRPLQPGEDVRLAENQG